MTESKLIFSDFIHQRAIVLTLKIVIVKTKNIKRRSQNWRAGKWISLFETQRSTFFSFYYFLVDRSSRVEEQEPAD